MTNLPRSSIDLIPDVRVDEHPGMDEQSGDEQSGISHQYQSRPRTVIERLNLIEHQLHRLQQEVYRERIDEQIGQLYSGGSYKKKKTKKVKRKEQIEDKLIVLRK
jgi:hypothetical protein